MRGNSRNKETKTWNKAIYPLDSFHTNLVAYENYVYGARRYLTACTLYASNKKYNLYLAEDNSKDCDTKAGLQTQSQNCLGSDGVLSCGMSWLIFSRGHTVSLHEEDIYWVPRWLMSGLSDHPALFKVSLGNAVRTLSAWVDSSPRVFGLCWQTMVLWQSFGSQFFKMLSRFFGVGQVLE